MKKNHNKSNWIYEIYPYHNIPRISVFPLNTTKQRQNCRNKQERQHTQTHTDTHIQTHITTERDSDRL